MDYLALADALAARYAPAAVVPPTGYRNIAMSTARPPNAITNSPSVVVWASKGEVVYEPGVRYDRTADFIVNLYYAQQEGDIPRESAALQAWLGVLLGQLEGQTKLGLGGAGVDKAIAVSWQIGSLTYAGQTWDGITINVSVWTETPVTLVP